MKVELSGKPECFFGFNDKLFIDTHSDIKKNMSNRKSEVLDLDDIRFHQCVRLGKFSADRTIAFFPPDGEFTLMKYRVSERVVRPPFQVIPLIVEHSKTRFAVQVNVSSTFNQQFTANQIVIKVPVPSNSAKAISEASIGSAKYEPTQHAVVWRIRNFPGQMEHKLSASVQLLATVVQSSSTMWDKPPISMEFLVPMATSSGMEVLFMNINEIKLRYQAERYVRYMTKAGNYLIRYPDHTGKN